jgi:hypothetical protein
MRSTRSRPVSDHGRGDWLSRRFEKSIGERARRAWSDQLRSFSGKASVVTYSRRRLVRPFASGPRWLRRTLAAALATAILLVVAPAVASAYSDSYYCQCGTNSWRADPGGAHNWTESQNQNKGSYSAYLWIGITSPRYSGWSESVSSQNPLPPGYTFGWNGLDYWAGHWPFQGWIAQTAGVSQLLWGWFYGP